MEANDQALTAEPPTDADCPDLEDVAAFLDGTLAPERRESMIEHLASCESCFEIFAGAARFQADEPQEVAELEPQQTPEDHADGLDKRRADRPFERRWSVRSRPWRRGAAAAIAALLAASVGLLPVWWRAAEISTAGLSAELLKRPAALGDVPWKGGSTLRGGGPAEVQPDVPPDLGDFQLGVRLLDLRLALARGNRKAADETLRRLDNLFGALWLPLPDIRAAFKSIWNELDHGTPPAALLPKAEAAENRLFAAGVEKESVELGSWTEACRLDAVARQPEIFRSRATRRLLERAQAPSTEIPGATSGGGSPDQGPAKTLREIKAAAGAEKLDFGALASRCEELLKALDADH
jgi:hypothetical protein